MRFRRNILIVVIASVAAIALGAKDKDRAGSDKKDEARQHAVSIKGMKFSPASITVKPGEKIVWTNQDDYDHTVVADDGSFKSGNLSRGDTFEHKFEKKGKYKYACSIHPRMKGMVIVGDE